MNYVNLIGTMCTKPSFRTDSKGRTKLTFSLKTKEPYLDAQGNAKSKSHLHNLSVWGSWTKLILELGVPGTNLAVEGKLVSTFVQDDNGKKRLISEVQVNDLVVI
jgi:single-strand DNA-binding protein